MLYGQSYNVFDTQLIAYMYMEHCELANRMKRKEYTLQTKYTTIT